MRRQNLPKAESGLLAAIALIAFVIFLPWSHDLTVADVSVFAWAMFGVMVMAPAAGLVLALTSREEGDA
ncbi:hypothetical protein [Blastococcus sp. SYSU DS1021]